VPFARLAVSARWLASAGRRRPLHPALATGPQTSPTLAPCTLRPRFPDVDGPAARLPRAQGKKRGGAPAARELRLTLGASGLRRIGAQGLPDSPSSPAASGSTICVEPRRIGLEHLLRAPPHRARRCSTIAERGRFIRPYRGGSRAYFTSPIGGRRGTASGATLQSISVVGRRPRFQSRWCGCRSLTAGSLSFQPQEIAPSGIDMSTADPPFRRLLDVAGGGQAAGPSSALVSQSLARGSSPRA
jgi:hypothetical protein